MICPHCGAELPAELALARPAPGDLLPAPEESHDDRLVRLALAGISNTLTRSAYERELRSFLAWWERVRANYPAGLTRETILAYRDAQQQIGRGAVSVNRALSAVRRLVREGAAAGLIDTFHATEIGRVEALRQLGGRTGRWLEREEVVRLLTTPPPTTPNRGRRDRAAICLMGLAGLRRAEAATVTVGQFQQRGDRDILADVVGKGGRIRTVPLHPAAAAAIRAWLEVYRGGPEDPLLPTIRNPDQITTTPCSSARLYDACLRYCRALGMEFRPHDLRRTFSVLAEEGGADLRSIQRALGHSSVTTTEIYLDAPRSLKSAAADKINL